MTPTSGDAVIVIIVIKGNDIMLQWEWSSLAVIFDLHKNANSVCLDGDNKQLQL